MQEKEEDYIHTLALVFTPGVGSVMIRQLISYCGGATNVFKADFKKLIKIPGIGEKAARTLLQKQGVELAQKEWIRCQKEGIRLCFYTDSDYPRRLKPLYDSPLVLYSQGQMELNAQRTVGIVGTRQVTDYGKMITETIIRDLVPYHTQVVSGLAYGVDITAHRACLKHQIPTIGVMASGLDVIYPAVHKRTALDMQQNGGILTENPMGTKPDSKRFPARNRIIAGMSDVTIVVESTRKGGSLITTEYAMNYHREVFAVPGPLNSPQSEGCHQLIKDHKAAVFTTVDEMAEALGWRKGEKAETGTPVVQSDATPIFDGFTQEEGQVLSLLKRQGDMQLDDLSWQSGIHLGKLATLLLNLEFQGMVRSLPGKKYALV